MENTRRRRFGLALLTLPALVIPAPRVAASPESRLEAPGLPAYGVTAPGFTVECWLRVRTMPGFDPFILRCVSAESGPCESVGSGYWALGICKLSECDPGTLVFMLQDEGRCEVIRSPSRVDDGQYHHVAVTLDGPALNMYLDGESEASREIAPIEVKIVKGMLVLGNSETQGSPFDGEIDELRIWNVARSAAEIRAAMTAELDSRPPSLAGYWKFNGNGDDASPSGNVLRGRNYVLYRKGRLGLAADIINIRSLR